MTREQITVSIPESMVHIAPEQDLSNLKSDIAVPERVGPECMHSPAIIMELRKHYRYRAPDDANIQLASPDSSMAHLEVWTRDL